MGEQQMKFQLSAPWANNTYAIPDKQKSISNDVDQSQKAPEDSDTTTSRQSTSGQNPGTHCHHCSKRLESVASLQVQLEALHDELQGLIQLRKRQEDQIHKLQRQLSNTQESNDERTRQIEFLEAQNRDCEQANQRLMTYLQNIDRELEKMNARAYTVQDYVKQSSQLKRLIRELEEQMDKQVSTNKYLSEEIRQD
ncbi:hypothetical protein BG003_001596 [Podila horticola]|nr:hypothetical protein BG003_001596 [Podila horticola]